MSDERGCVYVHAEVPSSDDVRTFYEVPSVVADAIRAQARQAQDAPFVDALVQVLERVYDLNESLFWARSETAEADRALTAATAEEVRLRAALEDIASYTEHGRHSAITPAVLARKAAAALSTNPETAA